ncbi:hypothetical protein ACFS2C_05225 [Prauserella oleivorans]|uniref:Uncharacterized protein n=1 Tax=Prauserella oleivorans TaxID=1478153 RepID=A0ABW5W4A8_9PSEU
MLGPVLTPAQQTLALVRRTTGAVCGALATLPRLTTVLADLRETAAQLERLATFAAAELPEIVYQLEAVRAQLIAIERQLAGESTVTPATPRNGSRPPS